MKQSFLIVAFLLGTVDSSLSGKSPQSINKFKINKLTGSLSILEDVQGMLTIHDIQTSKFQSYFEQTQNSVLDFPANNYYYWIKLNLELPADEDFIFFIDEAKLEHADLYYLSDDSTWRVIANGTFVPMNKKEIVHNFLLYPLRGKTGKSITLYLRLNPNGLSVPIYITSSRYFFQLHDTRFKLFFGLIIGVVLLIGLNSLAIFIINKDKLRLLYFFTATTFVIFPIFYNGYTLFLSDYIYKNTIHETTTLSFLSQLTILVYGFQFLQINKRAIWLVVWWKSCLWITVSLLLLSLFLYQYPHILIACAAINGILVCIICLTSGVIAWCTSSKARVSIFIFYTCAYILFLTFLVLELGHIYNGWSYVFFTRYLDLGFLCEAIGLVIAQNKLSSVEKEDVEKEKARMQVENIQLISDRNQILEEQVSVRTAELLNKTKISEELSEHLRIQSDELRNLNDFKDRLLSILAHDLKSPLNQLQSVLSLADQSLPEAELKSLLNQVRKKMGGTVDLTDNLLIWARSQMAGFQLKVKVINLRILVRNKIAFFQSVAEEKKILLVNNIYDDVHFSSDETIISVLLHNLIHNAIKFSRADDSITLFSNFSSAIMTISVTDTGLGMRSEEIQTIFGKSIYTKTGTANESGTGLGLKICKDLVNRIGGQIRIESMIGQGTTFYLDIPVQDN